MGPLQHSNSPQFKWAPNSNIDPGGTGPLNLIFANQFKCPPPQLNELPTIVLIQGARYPSI